MAEENGWRPDPFARFEERYFVGGHPTDLVRAAGSEAVDSVDGAGLPPTAPPPVTEPMPAVGLAPPEDSSSGPGLNGSGTTTEGSTQAPRVAHRFGKKRVLIALAVAVALLVGIVVAVSLNGGSGTSGNSTAATGAAGVAHATATAPDTSAASSPSQMDLKIVGQGFTQLPPDSIGSSYFTYGVVVENPNPTHWVARSISLNVALYNAAGTIVKVDTPILSSVLPGQKGAVAPLIGGGAGITRMEVQASVGRWEETDQGVGAISFEGTTTTPQDFGGVKTTTTLASSFTSAQSLVEAAAIYYDAQGNIIGGALTYVNSVPALGRVPIEITASTGPQGIVRTEVYASI